MLCTDLLRRAHMCVCVCVCVCARARARARACVQVPGGFKPLIIPVGGTQVSLIVHICEEIDRDRKGLSVCARANAPVHIRKS